MTTTHQHNPNQAGMNILKNCKSHFPKSDSQKLIGLLMIYHNTLIDQLNQEK